MKCANCGGKVPLQLVHWGSKLTTACSDCIQDSSIPGVTSGCPASYGQADPWAETLVVDDFRLMPLYFTELAYANAGRWLAEQGTACVSAEVKRGSGAYWMRLTVRGADVRESFGLPGSGSRIRSAFHDEEWVAR